MAEVMVEETRYLLKSKAARVPADSNKLRLSSKSFKDLCLHYCIPATFIFALSRYYLPAGPGYRISRDTAGDHSHELWYILPVRVQVECTDKRGGHAATTAGQNQMDPFHYLHLPDSGLDLRGSAVAVFTRYDVQKKSTTSIVINFMHGRWTRVAEEPQRRTLEAMEHSADTGRQHSRCAVHLVHLTSAIRWWTNSLHSVKQQLVVHEKQLQQEMNNTAPTSPDFYDSLNRTLHSMAAHMHRYQSDLNSMEQIASQVQQFERSIRGGGGDGDDDDNDISTSADGQNVELILSQIRALKDFGEELAKKVANILALLFNQMQITGNRLQLDNGRAMYEILRATEDEARLTRAMARESQKLAVEMRKDSLAMRTIAVVTMFFLPGATFAALLSMPFFQQNPWLSEATRVWVWIALTVPSTALAFAFFYFASWKNEKRSRRERDEEEGEGEELTDAGDPPGETSKL